MRRTWAQEVRLRATEFPISRPEPTISIRLLWPFARVFSGHAQGPTLLKGLKLAGSDLVFDQRIGASASFKTLERAVAAMKDPALGLRAGELTDEGTFGILEHAAASSADLQAAIEMVCRHFSVLAEMAETWLAIDDDTASFRYAPLLPHPVAANDLIVTASIRFAQRLCNPDMRPREVWLTHARPSHADQYAKHWQCPVSFDKPTNAIVFDAKWLKFPMRGANENMAIVFEKKAASIAAGLRHSETLSRRVRERLNAQLAAGSLEMAVVARSLRVSTATLRRKLDAEGASFSDILDEVRKEAAERYLTNSQLTVTEIAYRLGFSHVRAFARAFRRWTGTSPTDFRAQ